MRHCDDGSDGGSVGDPPAVVDDSSDSDVESHDVLSITPTLQNDTVDRRKRKLNLLLEWVTDPPDSIRPENLGFEREDGKLVYKLGGHNRWRNQDYLNRYEVNPDDWKFIFRATDGFDCIEQLVDAVKPGRTPEYDDAVRVNWDRIYDFITKYNEGQHNISSIDTDECKRRKLSNKNADARRWIRDCGAINRELDKTLQTLQVQ